jgi:hypothetical protein
MIMPTVTPEVPGPDVVKATVRVTLGRFAPADAQIGSETNCNRTQEYGKLGDSSSARRLGSGISADHNGID